MAVGEKRNFYQFIHDSNFEKIFIPMIQRDYVQGRDYVPGKDSVQGRF